MSPFTLALAHYRLQFPDFASLGSGDPPATWKTEYDRVASDAFNNLLITSTTFTGGHASGVKQFDQQTLLQALHTRRSELDDDYDAWRQSEDGPLALENVRPAGIRVSIF